MLAKFVHFVQSYDLQAGFELIKDLYTKHYLQSLLLLSQDRLILSQSTSSTPTRLTLLNQQ
jgi:hypothetical protein